MAEMFAIEPPLEILSTTTIATSTEKRPPQTKTDVERGLTTTTFFIKVVSTLTILACMVYVSMASILPMAQRLADSESQLTKLL